MAETKYRWVKTYNDGSMGVYGDDGKRGSVRYRLDDNGILVYDPEPVSRHVDSLRWIAVDSGNNFRVLTGFVDGEKPAHGDDEFAVVCRVRDKAADDAMVEKAATLARERDEARAGFCFDKCPEWHAQETRLATYKESCTEHAKTLLALRTRIAELERELAEAKAYGDTKGTFADKQ